jgi:hypothetical protein
VSMPREGVRSVGAFLGRHHDTRVVGVTRGGGVISCMPCDDLRYPRQLSGDCATQDQASGIDELIFYV